MKEILGHYYILKYHTKKETHEYKLDIFNSNDNKINFKFELIVSGHFGRIGKYWEGLCHFQNSFVYLESQKKVDWKNQFNESNTYNTVLKIARKYPLRCLKDGNNTKLILSLELNDLCLYKINIKIEQISSSIINKIIEKFELEKKDLVFSPGKFWRISNLILKDCIPIRFELNNCYELICKYDLEIVKEEKRVINNDEILRTHYTDRVILDKDLNIILYEIIN